MNIVPIKYEEDKLLILDQTKLPNETVWLSLETKEEVWEAIYLLKVRRCTGDWCSSCIRYLCMHEG